MYIIFNENCVRNIFHGTLQNLKYSHVSNILMCLNVNRLTFNNIMDFAIFILIKGVKYGVW